MLDAKFHGALGLSINCLDRYDRVLKRVKLAKIKGQISVPKVKLSEKKYFYIKQRSKPNNVDVKFFANKK